MLGARTDAESQKRKREGNEQRTEVAGVVQAPHNIQAAYSISGGRRVCGRKLEVRASRAATSRPVVGAALRLGLLLPDPPQVHVRRHAHDACPESRLVLLQVCLASQEGAAAHALRRCTVQSSKR